MTLQEIGALLRQERERKGLSLEDVMQATKISRRNIEALEWGREDELPHLVYAKGFLKNYAQLLGLNPDKMANALTQAYVQACEDEEDVDLSAYRPGGCRSADAATAEGGFGVAKLGLSATLLLLLAGVGVAGYLAVDGRIEVPFASRLLDLTGLASKSSQDAARTASPAGARSLGQEDERGARLGAPAEPADKPVASGLPRSDQISAPPAAGMPASAMPGQAASAVTDQTAGQVASREAVGLAGRAGDEATARKAEKSAAPALVPEAASPAAPAPEGVASTGQVMVLEATEQCWVNVYVDGSKKKKTYVLGAGQTVELSYQKSLKLRLGNAGGVNLTHNGQALGAPGRSGEVLTLRYP